MRVAKFRSGESVVEGTAAVPLNPPESAIDPRDEIKDNKFPKLLERFGDLIAVDFGEPTALL
jgi:hypothetical protein